MASRSHEQNAVNVVCGRVVGMGLGGAAESLLGPGPIPIIEKVGMSEGSVGLGEMIVQFKRSTCGGLRFRVGLGCGHESPVGHHDVSVRDTRISLGVARLKQKSTRL